MSLEEERFRLNGAMSTETGNIVEIRKVSMNKIKLARNSRMDIDQEELSGLMQSIKSEGLLQPIGVIDRGTNGYEVCYGNRRFLACSKLGFKNLACIVHEPKRESDVDMKNLTENVQRRNISLIEVGRYATLLQEEGLTQREIGVRLGVSSSYVNDCLSAYNDIPKEFQNDLEVRVGRGDGSTATPPGKISMATTRAILKARADKKITMSGVRALLKSAKSDSRFQPSKVSEYVAAYERGSKDFVGDSEGVSYITVRFRVKGKERERIEKHIEDSPYGTIPQFLLAVLRGEKSYQVKMIN